MTPHKMHRTLGAVTMLAASIATRTAFAQPPARVEPARSDARTVTLSLTEYNRLLDLSSRPPQAPLVAPVGAVLASAELRIRVEREAVRGTFNLSGNVLRAGVNRVNLIQGATLIDGSASGRPLPLSADGNVHSALLPGPGPFALTLEWGAPLTFAPGRASFTLPVPLAGTAHATLDLPGDQADVHLSAGLITRRTTANGRTLVDVTLKSATATEVWWSMRDSAPIAAARDVRALADVMTLITIGDSDVRMVSLVDVTVVQGEPRSFELRLPAGYELTAASGASIESTEQHDDRIVLAVDPALRRHQFLVSLERAHAGGSFELETEVISLPNVQRERGEIAVEGIGTLELSTTERNGMHRLDVRELNGALQSLSRAPMLAGFRYQRTSGASIGLAMNVTRFADAAVLAAVADRATATTLVTGEGRTLTEVQLIVQNRAQPYLKVMLPPGATMVSVEVAGEPAKPVLAPDGTRVPLLRPGFRPTGPYPVSFVYLHAGTRFERKGDREMTLPRMDIPIGVVNWEVFVPEIYSVRAIDGNVIDGERYGIVSGIAGGVAGGVAWNSRISTPASGVVTGQIRGRAVDSNGSVLPGVTVVLEVASTRYSVVTGADGSFVLSGIPSGNVVATAELMGFTTERASFLFDQQPRQIDFTLTVGALDETVTVAAESPRLNTYSAYNGRVGANAAPKAAEGDRLVAPSVNVTNLQRRVAGVLPVRVDVPRAGTSHRFVKPLVVDQETVVSLRYKRR